MSLREYYILRTKKRNIKFYVAHCKKITNRGEEMKGIILAGGAGTRLYPITKALSKQALPVYDKPMIYYPLAVLMMANIREILIISTPRDIITFKELLGDGSEIGLDISYAVQNKPRGLAEAFIIGEAFIGKECVSLVLGDNIFYGQELSSVLEEASHMEEGAIIFGYPIDHPEEFGIVEFDEKFNVISIEEKPKIPKSHYAVPGLYFYDHEVVSIAKNVKPSSRGEIEITSINNEYLTRGKLKVELLKKGIAWLDTGTYKALLKAANFVETVQTTQKIYIGSLEEIAYKKGYINSQQLLKLIDRMAGTDYKKHLISVAKEV